MTRITVAGGRWAAADNLIRALTGLEVKVRLLTQNPRQAYEIYGKNSVEFMGIDINDPLSLRVGFQDTDRALLFSGVAEQPSRHDIALIDAAVQAGVPFLVNLSAGGDVDYRRQSMLDWLSKTDEHLFAQGMLTTLIHPAVSLDAVFDVAANFLQTGQWGGVAGNGRAAFVDLRDVVSATVRVLLEGPKRHGNKIYHLTGPSAVSMGYIADCLSENPVRPIRYHHRSLEEQRRVFRQAGLPSARIDALLAQESLIRDGFYAPTTADVFDLIGRPACSAVSWIAEHFGDIAEIDRGFAV